MRFHARAAATALLIAIIGAPGVGAAAAPPAGSAVGPAGSGMAEFAWAVVAEPSNPSYDPGYEYSRVPGSSTTVTRTAQGSWTITWDVNFPNPLANGGNVQVSPLGNTPHRCWVQSWNADAQEIEAKVRCGNANTLYADTPFVVVWLMHLSPYNTYEGMRSGYAWMNLSESSGTPNAGYQATSGGGTVTSTRTGEGAYTVTMPGVEEAEHVVVSGWRTDTSTCRPTGWKAVGAALAAKVVCRQLGGDPSDQLFTIFAARNVSVGAPQNGWAAYAVVRKPKLATYRVAAADGFNNADRPITVRRVARGRWTIRFVAMPAGGAAVVSPLGGRADCQVASLPRTGKDLRIGVRCFSPAGAPVDSPFVVSWGK